MSDPMTSPSPKACLFCEYEGREDGTGLKMQDGEWQCESLAMCRVRCATALQQLRLESRVSPGVAPEDRTKAVHAAAHKFQSAVRRALNTENSDARIVALVEQAVANLTADNAMLPPLDEPKLIRSSAPEEATDDGVERFAKWFIENYPPDTEITVPAWHASKIFRAAQWASRSSGQDQTAAATDSDATDLLLTAVAIYLKDGRVRPLLGMGFDDLREVGAFVDRAADDFASLKQQVIDSALRSERLEADRTALIEGKIWNVVTYEPHYDKGWRHSTQIEQGPSPLYSSADEALDAYRASLSPQP